MATPLPTCPTCGTPFHKKQDAHLYCRPACRPSAHKNYGRHRFQCPQCAQFSSKRGLCSSLCKQAWLRTRQQRTTIAHYAHPAQPPSLASYQKDDELFAQRMVYTFNGITWWATPCCYCGDPAEAQDHVFPLAAFEKLRAAGRCAIPNDLLRIVPSCHECNSLLGDKVFRTFADKRLYAKTALSRRYYEVLDDPQWEPDELSTLEGRMRTWITQRQEARDLVFERLRF